MAFTPSRVLVTQVADPTRSLTLAATSLAQRPGNHGSLASEYPKKAGSNASPYCSGPLYAADVDGYLGSYATLGLTLLGAVVVFGGAFSANRLLRPRRPAESPGKYETYECGLDPVGGDWAQAQIRYYVYAYLLRIVRCGECVPLPMGSDLRSARLRWRRDRRNGDLRRGTRAGPAVRVAQTRSALDLTPPGRSGS
jgi:NADH:ubiquinone oxidoreductase subunit 3 (subunit A)